MSNPYKGKIYDQSNFSHWYATWANNHRGWAKMKKRNKRIAKKRLKRDWQKQRKIEDDLLD